MNNVKNLVIISLIVLIGNLATILYMESNIRSEDTVSSSFVEQQITQISELAVLKYNYKNVVSYKDYKDIMGINLPFTKKSFIITYTGYVKAGTNLENLDININHNNSITIKLGSATILDNVINEESAEIYNQDSGIFNKLEYEDLFEALGNEKSKIKNQLIKDGFLEKANEHIRMLLTGMLNSMGFEEVKIIFILAS